MSCKYPGRVSSVVGYQQTILSTHPQNYNDRNEDTRSPAFEQDIGQGLENRIRDEEHSQGDIILGISDVEILLQTSDFGITDIRPVSISVVRLQPVCGVRTGPKKRRGRVNKAKGRVADRASTAACGPERQHVSYAQFSTPN